MREEEPHRDSSSGETQGEDGEMREQMPHAAQSPCSGTPSLLSLSSSCVGIGTHIPMQNHKPHHLNNFVTKFYLWELNNGFQNWVSLLDYESTLRN